MSLRPLTILSVAYPLFPVSENSSGGAEQVLYLLERGLVQAGHRSYVIAADGSTVGGTLISTPVAPGLITEDFRGKAQQQHREGIAELLRTVSVDVIHYHGLDFHTYHAEGSTPSVATLHLPAIWYNSEAFRIPDVTLVCVSDSQAASIPGDRPFPVIQNGVDVRPPLQTGHDSYLLWLGRICPEKAPHIALRVARELDLPLLVAGPVHGFPEHLDYFETQIKPLLDHSRRYIGPVGRSQKLMLLQRARALLNTSLAPETSSLVAMEAICSGTPVIAFGSGALPEIVSEGVTGLIVESEQQIAGALNKTDRLRRNYIAEEGCCRFSAKRMVTEYFALYEQILTRAAR